MYNRIEYNLIIIVLCRKRKGRGGEREKGESDMRTITRVFFSIESENANEITQQTADKVRRDKDKYGQGLN